MRAGVGVFVIYRSCPLSSPCQVGAYACRRVCNLWCPVAGLGRLARLAACCVLACQNRFKQPGRGKVALPCVRLRQTARVPQRSVVCQCCGRTGWPAPCLPLNLKQAGEGTQVSQEAEVPTSHLESRLHTLLFGLFCPCFRLRPPLPCSWAAASRCGVLAHGC